MGHAGAIVSATEETATAKIGLLREAGVTVMESPARTGATMAEVLGKGSGP